MVGKKSSLIVFLLLHFILFGCSQKDTQQDNEIMELKKIVGLQDKHQSELPLWAKFTKNKRSKDERGFLLFSDGSMYNYSSNDSVSDQNWNYWGTIESDYIDRISTVLIELHSVVNTDGADQQISDSSVAIQYLIDKEAKLAFISKDYKSKDGKFLKEINDLVNQGIANRPKKKKQSDH